MNSSQLFALGIGTAPLLPLCMSLYNRFTWPRVEPRPTAVPAETKVSVLVPARNEAQNIEACLDSILLQGEVVSEVLVYSDESTDGTESIVAELAARDARVQLIVGKGLPEGWVGKPHACDVLGRAARSAWLLFIDADVRLAPGAVSGLLQARSAVDRAPAPGGLVLTALPRQLARGFWLQLLQPLLLLTYLSWLPLAWANRQRDPRFLAACGQLLFLSRETFAGLDGFRAVGSAVVDDMAFCRSARRRGAVVAFLDGHALASCRMYDSLGAFWRGFSKNLFLGLGSELRLLLAIFLHAACFLAPFAALVWWLAARPVVPEIVVVGAVIGITFNLIQRAVIAAHHRQHVLAVLLHPWAVLALVLLGIDSWRRARFGGVQWAGRTYEGRLA